MKINWKELGRQLWAAVKPVLLAAVGGDENAPVQANPVTTVVPISAK